MLYKIFIILFYNTLVSWLWLLISAVIIILVKYVDRIKNGFRNYLGYIKNTNFQDLFAKSESIKNVIIHAVSVGEGVVAIELAKEIKERYPNVCVYLSTTHPDVFKLANKNKYLQCVFYNPLDIIIFTYRLLRKISPTLVILVETDFWLNYALSCKMHNIPLVLVNGRISNMLYKFWQNVPNYANVLFSCFDYLLVQTELDKEKLISLNLPDLSYSKINVIGNIKFDIDSKPKHEASATKGFMEFIKSLDRPSVVFGSLHQYEFDLIKTDVIAKLVHDHNFLLIVAPRNIKHAKDWVNSLQRLDNRLKIALRSQNEISKNIQIIILDSIGELSSLYSIAEVAFVGGTLDCNVGGHNVIEVISKNVPLIIGNFYRNFVTIVEDLKKVNGIEIVNNKDELYKKILHLIKNKAYAKKMADNAYRIYIENKGALARSMKVLDRYLN